MELVVKSKFESLYAGKMTREEYEQRSKTIARKVYDSKLINLIISQPAENLSLIQDYIIAETEARETETIDSFIAEWLHKTDEESFCRFGDRNHLTKDIRRNYIKKDGIPLDIQAQEMTEISLREISPEDLYQFIISNPKGQKSYRNEAGLRADEIKALFKEKTGVTLTPDLVKAYQKVVEKLIAKPSEQHEECPF
jgi:hypothetical protein